MTHSPADTHIYYTSFMDDDDVLQHHKDEMTRAWNESYVALMQCIEKMEGIYNPIIVKKTKEKI